MHGTNVYLKKKVSVILRYDTVSLGDYCPVVLNVEHLHLVTRRHMPDERRPQTAQLRIPKTTHKSLITYIIIYLSSVQTRQLCQCKPNGHTMLLHCFSHHIYKPIGHRSSPVCSLYRPNKYKERSGL